MLILHHGDTSVASAKVRLALAEKRLDFESCLYDLGRGEHKNPQYLSINPRGVVPTLIHNGVVVRESNVILEYLEDAFPEPPMMPPSAAMKAPVRLMLREIDHLHDACSILSSSLKLVALRMAPKHEWELFLSRVADPAKRDRQRQLLEFGFDAPAIWTAIHRYRQIVHLADAMLRDDRWLSGSSIGLADCAALPYFHRADSLGLKELWTWSPLVRTWLERMKDRPSFEMAILRWTGTSSPYRACAELQEIVSRGEVLALPGCSGR